MELGDKLTVSLVLLYFVGIVIINIVPFWQRSKMWFKRNTQNLKLTYNIYMFSKN